MLKIAYFLRKLQTSRANNPRIFSINNAKISGYGSYMNTNIEEDFQICISVPLIFLEDASPPNYVLSIVA